MPVEQVRECFCGRCAMLRPWDDCYHDILLGDREWEHICFDCYDLLEEENAARQLVEAVEFPPIRMAEGNFVWREEIRAARDRVQAREEQLDTDNQSEEDGNMITSKRSFGVEFEVVLPEERNNTLRDALGGRFQLVHDGSIDAGIEVVSPVLKGKAGENQIVKACKALETVGATFDESCSMHVHFGAGDLTTKGDATAVTTLAGAFKLAKASPDTKYTVTVLSESFTKLVNKGRYADLSPWLRMQMRPLPWVQSVALDYELDRALSFPLTVKGIEVGENVTLAYAVDRSFQMSKTPLLRDRELAAYEGDLCYVRGDNDWDIGMRSVMVSQASSTYLMAALTDVKKLEAQNKVFTNLKSVLATYATFDDVIAAMLPVDRRDNDYTERFIKRMTLREIDRTEDIIDLALLWDATEERGLSYIPLIEPFGNRERRYCGVNLNSLRKHGTLEIRYHGGCVSATPALHWVKLHQAIIDTAVKEASSLEAWIDHLHKTTFIVNADQKARVLFRKIGLKGSPTEAFYLKLIEVYAGEDAKLIKELETAKQL